MSKFSGGSIIGTGLVAGLMLASMPAQAVAQRKVIENDLSKCANNAGPAMLVEVSGFERATGKLLWNVTMADYKLGFSATSAPLVVKDMVIVGNGGGEYASRGFVAALRTVGSNSNAPIPRLPM